MICSISNDRLDVFLSTKPIEGCEFFELDTTLGSKFVLDKLKEKNIRFGIQETVIDTVCNKGEMSSDKIIIAKGESAIDEGVELKFNFEHAKMPDLENSENADFHNLGFGIDVFEGQLLAEQYLKGPGAKGRDVYGKEIPFKKSHLKPLTYNANIIVEKTGPSTRFIAKIDGVLLNDKKDALYIEPELNIHSNIDFKIGNLSSSHPININGDITSGFFVRSKKDIQINGSIEKGAIVESDASIYISRGINQGANIISKGNLECKFAQSANLKADGDITITGHCYDSNLFCKGKFTCNNKIVKGEKGVVIGGQINAIEGMTLESVGSSNSLTHLITGYDFEQKQEHDKLKNLLLEINSDLKRLIRNLSIDLLDKSTMKKQLSELNESEKIHNLKILKQISLLKKQEISVENQKIALSQKKETLFLNSFIRVQICAFPDLKLDINNCFLNIYKKYSSFEASEINAEISIKKLAP